MSLVRKWLTTAVFAAVVGVMASGGLYAQKAVINGPAETQVGEVVLLTSEGSEGTHYMWIFPPGTKAMEGAKNCAVIFEQTGKQIVYLAVSTKDGLVGTSLEVEVDPAPPAPGPGPDTDPKPDPKPKPEPEPKPEPVVKYDDTWILLLEETDSRPQEAIALLTDTQFWKSFEPLHKFRRYDISSPASVTKGYDKQVADVGQPALLVMAVVNGESKVLGKLKLPAPKEDIQKFITKATGK